MAKRRKRRTYRRSNGLSGDVARVAGGAIYGAVNSQLKSLITNIPVLNQIDPAYGMGIAAFLVKKFAKPKSAMLKEALTAPITIAGFKLGENLMSGGIGSLFGSSTTSTQTSSNNDL